MHEPINGRALCYEKVAWAYEKWIEGYTYYELGDALGCSFKTIRRSFDYYGFNHSRSVRKSRKKVLVWTDS